jgi:hypothetical protein
MTVWQRLTKSMFCCYSNHADNNRQERTPKKKRKNNINGVKVFKAQVAKSFIYRFISIGCTGTDTGSVY